MVTADGLVNSAEGLFVAEGLDGIEQGGATGRIDAEKDPDGRRKAKGHHHRPERHPGGKVHEE
jgi:hypothetical protein